MQWIYVRLKKRGGLVTLLIVWVFAFQRSWGLLLLYLHLNITIHMCMLLPISSILTQCSCQDFSHHSVAIFGTIFIVFCVAMIWLTRHLPPLLLPMRFKGFGTLSILKKENGVTLLLQRQQQPHTASYDFQNNIINDFIALSSVRLRGTSHYFTFSSVVEFLWAIISSSCTYFICLLNEYGSW